MEELKKIISRKNEKKKKKKKNMARVVSVFQNGQTIFFNNVNRQ